MVSSVTEHNPFEEAKLDQDEETAAEAKLLVSTLNH